MTAQRALLAGLVDDAGLFPPTALPMDRALDRHRADQRAGHGMLTRRFLCPASRIGELRALLEPGDRIRVGLIADTGPHGLGPALAVLAAEPALELAVLELPSAVWDAAPADVLRAAADHRVPVFLEPARLADVQALAPALAAAHLDSGAPLLGVKLRCGGVRTELFPEPAELAGALVAAAASGVPVKATAGLHRAVRHTDPATGLTHHGYLNLLVAAVSATSGADTARVAELLGETDGSALVRLAAAVGPDTAAAARRTLTAYGSCSTRTPLDEARSLGLWPEDTPTTRERT